MPTCRELGIGMLAYSPMGRGILTGSFKPEDLPADDMRRKLPGTYYASENLEAVRQSWPSQVPLGFWVLLYELVMLSAQDKVLA